jgi:hypothetical protein
MPGNVPKVGQLAFRGNARRAMNKFTDAAASLELWISQHPLWPVKMFTPQQLVQLQALAAVANANLKYRVPAPV